jgi:hypothetical protein
MSTVFDPCISDSQIRLCYIFYLYRVAQKLRYRKKTEYFHCDSSKRVDFLSIIEVYSSFIFKMTSQGRPIVKYHYYSQQKNVTFSPTGKKTTYLTKGLSKDIFMNILLEYDSIVEKKSSRLLDSMKIFDFFLVP